MATIRVLDPVTRLEGHLKITVNIDTVNGVQQVVWARASGTMFRGFEEILRNRPPEDAPHITQRICGVCPVSHGLAAVMALDQAAGITVPTNARLMRNLVLGANFIQSHILHFYHLALLDYVDGPATPPWQPTWSTDKRLSGAEATTLVNHYVQALEMRRKAHEMGALFGGRLPHPPTYIAGGFTTTPRADRISQCHAYLNELIPFIQNVYIPDVETVANAYPDYYELGGGPRNLLAYGVFDLDPSGTAKLLRRGRAVMVVRGIQPVDVSKITEHVTRSWYEDSTNGLNPASGQTVPVYPKTNGYSWLKAPRYGGQPYEVGALARMVVNGDYTNGVSVMDRHWARAYEALKIALAMRTWLSGLSPTAAVFTPYTFPASVTAYGLTEAPRGALGHWIRIQNGVLTSYQIITPTCWNASPRDGKGLPGTIEHALGGVPVRNIQEPIEVVRIIHSFDPCLSCAVHVMRPEDNRRVITLDHDHGDGGHEHAHEENEAEACFVG